MICSWPRYTYHHFAKIVNALELDDAITNRKSFSIFMLIKCIVYSSNRSTLGTRAYSSNCWQYCSVHHASGTDARAFYEMNDRKCYCGHLHGVARYNACPNTSQWMRDRKKFAFHLGVLYPHHFSADPMHSSIWWNPIIILNRQEFSENHIPIG